MTTLPELAILIVNYRSKDYVRRCLETVLSTCATLRLQIIVVDGASFDGCGEMVRTEFPEVQFIQSEVNAGFGAANNLGFRSVVAPMLLLLNPDTELHPGAVAALLQALRTVPSAGLVGARLLNSDGSLQTSCVQALPTPWNHAVESDFLRALLPDSHWWRMHAAFKASGPVPVEAVSGACMMLGSETFRAVNGFSPEYFMYAEDMDLCAKIRRIGLEVVHAPDAHVVHHGGGSSRTEASQFSTVMQRVALETYMRIHHGALSALSYRWLQGLTAILRLLLLAIARLFSRSNGSDAIAASMKKWRFVLQWALGVSKIAHPGAAASNPTQTATTAPSNVPSTGSA